MQEVDVVRGIDASNSRPPSEDWSKRFTSLSLRVGSVTLRVEARQCWAHRDAVGISVALGSLMSMGSGLCRLAGQGWFDWRRISNG